MRLQAGGGSFPGRVAGFAVLVGATYAFWRWVAPFALPFLLAAVLAAAVAPLAGRWEQRLPPALAAAAALAVTVGGGCLGVLLLLGLLMRELARLAAHVPRDLAVWQGAWRQWLAAQPWLRDWLAGLGEGKGGSVAGWVRLADHGLRAAVETLARLPDLLLLALVAVMAAFFLLRDRPRWLAIARRWIPAPWRSPLAAVAAEVMRGLKGFVCAQGTLLGITAGATGAGLALVGSPYAVLGGLVAGLLDLVPYLGPTALLLPWAATLWLMGRRVAAVQMATVMVAVVLLRQMVEPRLVGDNMGLHPLTVLVALYVGIRLFGSAGFVVGPVSAVMLKAAARALRLVPE